MLNKIYEKLKEFIKNNYKFLICLVILNILFWVELPYVIYTPGGAIDLSDRITIKDEYNSSGKLQMAYVSAVKASIPFTLASFIIPDWDLTPKDEVTLEDESISQMQKKDRMYMEESINNAKIAALKELGKEIKVTKVHNKVVYVSSDATTDLKMEDEIISVNGKKINSLEEYKKEVESSKEGDILNLKILRNSKEKDITIKVYNTEYGLKTGISMVSIYDFESDVDINIKSKMSESGPSGGLMMTLGIYNALTKDDITKGKNIVGTGTIDKDGNIGEIGGVKYKLIGAVRNKANVFICPEENYKEAKKLAKEKDYDIIVLTGKNLEEIINKLKELS